MTLSAWFAQVGDLVLEGERLVEVLTEGATFDVVAPASGRMAERAAYERDILNAGQVLGFIGEPGA